MTFFPPLHLRYCLSIIVVFLLLLPSFLFGETNPALKEIPDSLVCLEYEALGDDQPLSYALVVEKESQTLSLYSFNGSYHKELTYSCSTGEVPGPKSVSGDKKTPEGVYFFKSKFEKKYLSDTYGDFAFPMDYPNLMDRLQGKNGNSIWMHGTNKPLKSRDSNGCIVLENADIIKLAEYITLSKTPIIVEEKVHFIPTEKSRIRKTQIMDFLSKWNNALENGAYHDYLSYYDTAFIPDISWWQQWQTIKKDILTDRGHGLSTGMDHISVFKQNEMYVARFDQVITTHENTFHVGSKKLYIKHHINKDGKRFIISGEIFQPDVIKKQIAKNPFLVACKKIKTTISADKEITELINGWISAWSSKDIKTYGDFYATDFISRGMNLTSWLNKKRKLNNTYDYINVTINNLEIQKGKKYITATFMQYYESDAFKAEGEKKLILKLEDDRWKIYREIWKTN
jgi:murein L,D-transpeptidase YafK